MFLRSMFVATLSCAAACVSARAEPPGVAPRVSVDSINALSLPDRPFDEKADAPRIVDAAFVRAAQDHKDVLIDLGGNWCADCRILAAVMALPEVEKFLDSHYEVVVVDIGRHDRNLAIPARYGITDKHQPVPAILIVTPGGHLVNAGHVEALADARKMTPQAIADWFAQWAR